MTLRWLSNQIKLYKNQFSSHKRPKKAMHSGEAWAVSAALTLLAFLKKGLQHLWSCIAIILTFCWLNLFIDLCIDTKNIKSESPCWAVLDFWKINLEKSSLTNWIFSLFQTGFLLPVWPTKIKLELKWNFHILKLKILKWKIYPVTLDVSKDQWRSTGG